MDHAWSGRPAPHRVAAPIEPQAGLVEGRAVAADAVLAENRLHVAREIHFAGRLRDRRLEGRHGDEDGPRDPASVHLVPPRKGSARAGVEAIILSSVLTRACTFAGLLAVFLPVCSHLRGAEGAFFWSAKIPVDLPDRAEVIRQMRDAGDHPGQLHLADVTR